ncbi:MAG: hypothetical protein P8Y62_00125 [candidate division WOR-3 bacterium]|jgi:hypothetical protein
MNIEQAKKAIKISWILALVSGGITLIFGIFSKYIQDTVPINANLGLVLDALIVFGLAFGIYKKSRICAVIMFVYFLNSQFRFTINSRTISNIPLALVFLFYFYQGIRGTFSYHKLTADEENKQYEQT